MIKDLILDLGAHIGDDTEFYLAKGFRVVAIDAHPGFACRLRHRFADELRSGQLQVVNVAIAECAGFVELLESQVDSQWSTIDPGTARTKPGDFRALTVPAIPFDRVLAQFGVPYFLKIDVEGSEKHVINELKSCKSLPVHISFEVNAEWVGLASVLVQLGYAHFKLVNQAHVHDSSLPYPAREGRYVDWRFRGYTSGPFGFETPGDWSSRSTFIANTHKYLTQDVAPGDWFDIHATLTLDDRGILPGGGGGSARA